MAETVMLPDRGAISAWLRPHGLGPVVDIARIEGGQSNPTYRLTTPQGAFVLRARPQGKLLAKAHLIEREYRVMAALAGSGVPVPRMVGFCDDPAPIDSAFYVMTFVPGRTFFNPLLPDLPAPARAAMFNAMNETAAQLHAVDPIAAGLGDYGRPAGFMARQVARWTAQYRATEPAPIPAMEALIDWLPANLPPEQPAAIFHGDLRMDNLLFHPTEPRVVALLDWELSTLGDPIADFAYNVALWRVPPALFRGLAGADHATSGIPDEHAYVEAYLARTGRTALPHWGFYLAFSLFRLAAIIQGVAGRAAQGNASSADAASFGARVAPLADIGLRIVRDGA